VFFISGLAGVVSQTPLGAMVDAMRAKRALLAGAVAVATSAALMVPLLLHFLPVAIAGVAGASQRHRGNALSWVHAERLVHKLDAFTDRHQAAQTRIRSLIWNFYARLKDYRLKPSPRRAVALSNGSAISSAAAPASSRWTTCWRGCKPTRRNC
jgi:hypothetical protein